MNDRQREQIARIIELASNSSRGGLALAIQQIYASHSTAGRLGSGSTMVAIVAEMRRVAGLLLSEIVTKTAAVSLTPAAFEEIASGIQRWLRACEDELSEVARTTSRGRLQGSAVALELGQREFEKVKHEVEQRLEIERYHFEPEAQSIDVVRSIRAPRGGRPPAEFWDDMWAAIAAQLYDGTLQPKTQADIERSMADWIQANGHDAASSTIRGRARRLADRLEL